MVCEVCVKCGDAGGGGHTTDFAEARGGSELSGDEFLEEGEEEEEVAVEVSIRTREGEGEGVGCGGGGGEGGISGAMLLAVIPRELGLDALN